MLAKVGDHVTPGQPLARFDNVEAGELATQREGARADLARLRVQLGTSTRQADRARRLVEIGAVPQREYEAMMGACPTRDAQIACDQIARSCEGVNKPRCLTLLSGLEEEEAFDDAVRCIK